MNFTYELVNAEHLSPEQREEIQMGLDAQIYVCQQEFEKLLDKYHQINVLAEAAGEATVTKIEIEDGKAWIELDCSEVKIE